MPGLVGQMRAAILHLRNPRILVDPTLPLLVRRALLALTVNPSQLFPRRRLDALEIPDQQRTEVNPWPQLRPPNPIRIEPCAQGPHKRVEALGLEHLVRPHIKWMP
jgi:hypothetical protein